MPFNQQMSVPVQLTLRSVVDGLRLFAQPLSELTSLRGPKHEWTEITPDTSDNRLRMLQGDLFEITFDFSPDGSESLGLDLRGTPLVYDVPPARTRLQRRAGAHEPPGGPGFRLHVFLDRGSIEVFGNDGLVALSIAAVPADSNRSIGIFHRGAPAKVHALVVHELRSAWGSP